MDGAVPGKVGHGPLGEALVLLLYLVVRRHAYDEEAVSAPEKHGDRNDCAGHFGNDERIHGHLDSVNERRLVDSDDEPCAGDVPFEKAGAGALKHGLMVAGGLCGPCPHPSRASCCQSLPFRGKYRPFSATLALLSLPQLLNDYRTNNIGIYSMKLPSQSAIIRWKSIS